jgi:ferredoxin-NADP reductase
VNPCDDLAERALPRPVLAAQRVARPSGDLERDVAERLRAGKPLADLVELDRLQALAARIPNFTYSACVASPDSQYPLKGYVTQHIEPRHLNEGEVDVYLCGPPPMVEAVSQFIREQGLQPANFYYEKFAASA